MPTQADPQARWLVGRFDASVVETPTGPVYTIAPERYLDAALALEAEGFILSSVTALDTGEGLHVVAHLAADIRQVIGVHVPIPYDGSVASLTHIWPGADWQEREAAEMFGITFVGHPDPRRLLLTDDFVGHPLRKSFVTQGVQR